MGMEFLNSHGTVPSEVVIFQKSKLRNYIPIWIEDTQLMCVCRIKTKIFK